MIAPSRRGGAFAAAIFAVALVAIATTAVALSWPTTRSALPPPGGAIVVEPIRQAVEPTALEPLLGEIAACGRRVPGTPGLERTAELIVASARALGAEVFEMPVRMPRPVTQVASLVPLVGDAPAGLVVVPFKPNLLQPVVTPEGGITAQLIQVDDAWDASGAPGAGAIALVDAAQPPSTLGMVWSRYAARGFSALIITHSSGLHACNWPEVCNQAESVVPINFPRVAASPEVLALAGTRVRLDAQVRWETVTHRALLARLTPTRGPAGQAVVISVPYDQVAALPDLTPSAEQDVPLATALATFRALAAQRDQLGRDVLLVATAGGENADDGLAYLLSAAGAQQGGEVGRAWWSQRAADLARRAATYGALAQAAAAPGLLSDVAATEGAIAALSESDREAWNRLQRQVINDQVAELNEVALAFRVAMQRGTRVPGAVPAPALLDPYIQARQAVGRLSSIASWSPATITARAQAQVVQHGLAERIARRIAEASSRIAADRLQADCAVRIGSLFASYAAVLVVEPRPVSADPIDGVEVVEEIAVHRGTEQALGPTGQSFNELCQRLIAEAGPGSALLTTVRDPQDADGAIANMPVHATHWSGLGYPAVALIHLKRDVGYKRITSPAPTRTVRPPAQLLRLTADLVALLASGRGAVPAPQRAAVRGWGGQVVASGIGAGLIPDHPLAGAVVSMQVQDRPADHRLVGHRMVMAMHTDEQGFYGVPPGSFKLLPRTSYSYTPVVAAFGPDGLMRWVKDQGAGAQSLYRSNNFNAYAPPEVVNIIAFRADPVVITDRIDPRLLRPWAEILPLTRDGQATPNSFARWDAVDIGGQLGLGELSAFFLEPDRFCIFTLNAGSPENPLVRDVRSVLLGPPTPPGTVLSEVQPDGLGYLPADRPWITDTAQQAASSLLRLDARRLRQQVQQGIARPELSVTDDAARAALARATSVEHAGETLKAAREAGAMAQQNHERIRDSIAQAVANIVWYLCLLVPFALFAEKLVVGSNDVRRQILWATVIFLVAFALLALLHPAFPLLSSPAMILLGFVIMLIALGVSVVFLGRFQENLRGMQARRGQVEGARVDAMGVMTTAFLLGLNGLSRRKVRTGLTSATLVLITFALICFAGIRRADGIAVTPVGPAAYQGLLVKDASGDKTSAEEVTALRARYGPANRVCERSVLAGVENAQTKVRGNPQLDLLRTVNDVKRIGRCSGALLWQYDEPLAERLRLVAGSPWKGAAPPPPAKPAPGEAVVEPPIPVMISEATAEELRLPLADLAAGPVAATLNNQSVVVTAVFAASSLGGLRDLDGRSVLPADIPAMRTLVRNRASVILFGPDEPLIPAERLIILPRSGFTAGVPSSEPRLVSCAVVLDGMPYREANELIANHQRISGQQLAYGLDGTAFIGRPTSGGGFGGVDLLIPLLIAALTVLNTMRGSVYERRDEIAVFNAVGIAPRYITMMFFAEALVYAVVGAVAGFLLSLILGRGLAALGLDAGLKLDVASLAPVWASLALAAAVFLSTWFPARQAAEIAAPSDESGWKMPEPEGDRMVIELPFAFDARDRIGVLAFFARWFRDYGEGGIGPFQAGAPLLSAVREDGVAVPSLAVRVWLKPFDQGVAQDLRIELRPDAHGENLARLVIERSSGSRDAWLRLNRPFMGVLRRHFLYWRAVDPAMRAELYSEACALLRTASAGEPAHV